MTDIPGNQPPQGYPPQPYPPQQYPPPYPPGYYPPPKKGPSALKIVLIIVAIIVGLGIVAVGVVTYGVYKLAKSGNITTSTQPATASDLGVALYPGAEQKANVRMTVLGKNVLTATFLTSDAKDQVVTFYQNALGPQAQVQTILNETQFTLNTGAGGLVTVKISSGMGVESGKTQIVIAHATDAAAPSQ
jgi:flagellar basal body-associated protein FliL